VKNFKSFSPSKLGSFPHRGKKGGKKKEKNYFLAHNKSLRDFPAMREKEEEVIASISFWPREEFNLRLCAPKKGEKGSYQEGIYYFRRRKRGGGVASITSLSSFFYRGRGFPPRGGSTQPGISLLHFQGERGEELFLTLLNVIHD